MPELPVPFNSSFEQFSVMVSILEELTAEGKVRLRISPASNLSFRVEPSVLNEKVETEGIDQASASGILREISSTPPRSFDDKSPDQ